MRSLDRSYARSLRLGIGGVVITLGRRLQNLGHVLQVPGGFELRRLGLSARTVQTLRQTTRSSDASPRTVLDVGAHRGEFLSLAAAAFPHATIHCFEPVPESFMKLEEQARNFGSRVHCHLLALGRQTGELTMNINKFTAASSTFDVSPLHARAFPETADEPITQSVRCQQLDLWADDYELEQPILLKLDVQGGEIDVLEGARRILGQTSSVLVEVSFDELYLGAPLAHDVMRFLADRGFHLMEFLSYLRDPTTERLLQADAIFVANSARDS